MTPTYCQECRRANGEAATRCLWCGVPIVNRASPQRFAATRIEIDYLEGIERFDDSATVRMIIGPDGIEVNETVPGSRTFKIPASSIVDANVVDASTVIEGEPVRKTRWRLELGAFAPRRRKKTADTVKHDYLLSIRYKQGTETRTAVFHNGDRAGFPLVERLARTVTTLVRMQVGGSSDPGYQMND